MSAFRLVRDSLGFYSQVPIEDEGAEPEPTEEFVSEVLETEGVDDLFDSVIPKRRGRPRAKQ